MSGHVSGVRTRMVEKQPGLVFTHCVAHRLELAVVDAIKSEEYLQEFSDLINGIFQFYYYSAVRRREFKELAEVLEEEIKQFGCLKSVRWLASRFRALSVIEKNYKVLIYDLESKSYEKTETGTKALGYLKKLKDPKFLFYLHFFMDFVIILRQLSLEFQRDELLIVDIEPKIQSAKVKLDMLTVQPGKHYKHLMDELSVDINGDIL